MTIHTLHLTTPIHETFRTHQVAGLFDLSLDELAGERFAHTLTAELPGLDEDWTIGAIVGPSGSGKTTLARAAYGDALYQPEPWPEDAALIDVLDCIANKAPTIGRGVGRVDDSSDGPPSDDGVNERITLTTGQGYVKRPSLKHLLRTLTAVGLASPPSWLKPYHVLSTGERFRADLARAILSHTLAPSHPRTECESARLFGCERGVVVMDEFTSTLDRTIACTASYALSKFLRSAASNPKSKIENPKFVALSCHTDFLPWLGPDWVLNLAREATSSIGEMERRRDRETERQDATGDSPSLHRSVTPSLRPDWRRETMPPMLPIAVRRIPQFAWQRFARHHYLSGGLSTAATCYGAFLANKALTSGQGDEPLDLGLRRRADDAGVIAPHTPTTGRGFESPIAFCAVLATLGHRRTKHITRLVVLPEYQGLGIGPRLAEEVAGLETAKGFRVTITASHPAVLAWCSRSPRWKYLGLKKTGSTRQTMSGRTIRCSTGRAVAAFEFVGCMSDSEMHRGRVSGE